MDEPVTAAAGGLLVLLGVYVGALSGRREAQIQVPPQKWTTEAVAK